MSSALSAHFPHLVRLKLMSAYIYGRLNSWFQKWFKLILAPAQFFSTNIQKPWFIFTFFSFIWIQSSAQTLKTNFDFVLHQRVLSFLPFLRSRKRLVAVLTLTLLAVGTKCAQKWDRLFAADRCNIFSWWKLSSPYELFEFPSIALVARLSGEQKGHVTLPSCCCMFICTE